MPSGRAASVERRRHPGARREPIVTRRRLPGDPDDDQAATSRRPWTASWSPALPAERQPAARPEVRLQAGLVRRGCSTTPPDAPRRGHPVVLAGDYNVVPTDVDIYNAARWLTTRWCSRGRARFQRLLAPGLDRRAATLHPDEPHVHLLGLPPAALAARRRPAPRPPSAERRTGPAPASRRRRSRRARPRERQRPRAGVDRLE